MSVRGGFQLGMALQLRLESGSEGSEEEDGGSISVLASGRAGGSPAWQCGCRGAVAGAELGARAGAEWQQRGDASEAVLGRLEALEADVRFLCTELGAEKLLWSSRFLELLQEQQGLRQRVSPPRVPPSPPQSPLAPWTLTPCPSCRNARGGGTAATAPSCRGERTSQVPAGARDRAQQVEAGDLGRWGASGEAGGGMDGQTCHLQPEVGWGNVLGSASEQHRDPTSSHLGTGLPREVLGRRKGEQLGGSPGAAPGTEQPGVCCCPQSHPSTE